MLIYESKRNNELYLFYRLEKNIYLPNIFTESNAKLKDRYKLLYYTCNKVLCPLYRKKYFHDLI